MSFRYPNRVERPRMAVTVKPVVIRAYVIRAYKIADIPGVLFHVTSHELKVSAARFDRQLRRPVQQIGFDGLSVGERVSAKSYPEPPRLNGLLKVAVSIDGGWSI